MPRSPSEQMPSKKSAAETSPQETVSDPRVADIAPSIRPYPVTDPRLQETAPDIWAGLQNLKTYSSIGRQLVAHLERTRIPLCEEKMGRISGLFNTRAAYPTGGHGSLVSLNPNRKENYEPLLAHEVFHSYQHVQYGLFRHDPRLNLKERILHSLLLEAGAETISATVCYSMKLNGHETPFETAKSVLAKDQAYARLYRIYEKHAWEINASEQNSPSPQVLKHAATQVFNAYLQSQGLVSAYAQGVISDYLKYINRDLLNSTPVKGDITLAKARTYCANLIDNIDLPQNSYDLFAGQNRLRQLAEWAEFTRWVRSEGESHFVRTKRDSLERNGNPFMNIKLEELCKRLERDENQHIAERPPVLDIACEMAGVEVAPGPGSSFNRQAARIETTGATKTPRENIPKFK